MRWQRGRPAGRCQHVLTLKVIDQSGPFNQYRIYFFNICETVCSMRVVQVFNLRSI